MDEAEVIELVQRLPGVVATTASQDNGAPEVAWGDTFFFYDPSGNSPAAQRFPFATLVTKDYPGFDTESRLDRPGVFRLNIGVGRRAFEELFGHSTRHGETYDYTVLDRVVPHPVYAPQGWVCVLNPGEATVAQVESLLAAAHAHAVARYERRGSRQ